MKVIRIGLTCALMGLTVSALALPSMLKDFADNNKVKPGGTISKAHCSLCHVGTTTQLNPYGADLKKALGNAKEKKLTAAMFKKVANLDSDKDGFKNAVEIKADTLPGDPKSKPGKAAKPGKPGKSGKTAKPAKK